MEPAKYGDGAPELDASSFDLGKWVEGITPARHAVTVYARGDLFASLDVVQARLQQAKIARDYAAVKELREQAAGILDVLEASSVDVVVEGWSQDRIEAFRKPLEDQGLPADEVSMRQVAAQVVEPTGFTADMLRRMYDVVSPQANAVTQAVLNANSLVPVVSIPS